MRFAIILLCISHAVIAAETNPVEIMKQYDEQVRSITEKVQMTMQLVNTQGKKRVRKLNFASKRNGEGKQNTFIQFDFPSDIKGTTLLTHEHSNADDDRWLYLPALRKVRRIADTDNDDNFMGSDFAYEDIEFEELEANQYVLLGTEKVENKDCYVIEAKPKNAASEKKTGYSKRVLWIGMESRFIVKAEYYNKRGELSKKRFALRLKNISGKWRPEKQEMLNVKTGHKTVLLYENYEIGAEVPDQLFSLRALQRGS